MFRFLRPIFQLIHLGFKICLIAFRDVLDHFCFFRFKLIVQKSLYGFRNVPFLCVEIFQQLGACVAELCRDLFFQLQLEREDAALRGE